MEAVHTYKCSLLSSPPVPSPPLLPHPLPVSLCLNLNSQGRSGKVCERALPRERELERSVVSISLWIEAKKMGQTLGESRP